MNAVGAIELAGAVTSSELGEARFRNAITLRRPRVALVSKDPPGTEVHLMRTLEANQFEVTRDPLAVVAFAISQALFECDFS